ncbi:MAG: NAD(P)H-hydrate dehydratase, partial [Paludibacter sp.]
LNTGLTVQVVLLQIGKLSDDCETNLQRLKDKFPKCIIECENEFIEPKITPETIIIDGLFGSGLSRPLSGIYAKVVEWINNVDCKVVAIDILSGLNGEENADLNNPIVKANYTFTLQFPKLSFLMAENAEFVGNWTVLDIGIHPDAIEKTESEFYYLEQNDIYPLLKKRSKFSHKGTFGHGLIVAGSLGMAGASVLSAKAALRSGAGLVTVHGPKENRIIVQTAIPEVIFLSDKNNDIITKVNSPQNYTAVAVGPGIGNQEDSADMLRDLFEHYRKPMIIDADALNIIALYKELLTLVPPKSILTPHPKEFERLFGKCNSSYERMLKAREVAKKFDVIVILKGANTLIAMPDGILFFNSTGNAGMATAGCGDVLTGMLVALLAQGYSPEDTAKIGVFLHGRAGDLALEKQSLESLIAGDIIEVLGATFKNVLNNFPPPKG